eukprot:gene35178-45556_t
MKLVLIRLVCFLAVIPTFALSSGASCVYLDSSPASIPTQACAGAVYYAFYLAADYTKELPNLVSSSALTSPYIPMPFQRPCKSVCTNAVSKCIGLLGLMGMTPNCSATMDYTRGMLPSSLRKPYQYDPSNNSAICNAMTTDFPVQGTREPYLQASNPEGACYGIVKELYVPPGPLLSSALAPMQRPYVVQTLIEAKLKSNFAALPVFISKECRFALKKYFCGSYMLAPSLQVFSNVLNYNGYSGLANSLSAEQLTYNFYASSYPHRDICTDYGKTPPNYMLTSTNNYNDGFTTNCPTGYVAPQTYDSRDFAVSGTGCAMACRVPMWTREEWIGYDETDVGNFCGAQALFMALGTMGTTS